MDNSLRRAAALLAAVGALGGGRVAAQTMPMVPSAAPGGGPVMPTAPATPVPMPGSDAPHGPMIPRTMPGMPGVTAAPMPMPGANGPDAPKAVVHIRFTIVDTRFDITKSDPLSRDPRTGVRDDLRTMRSAAKAHHVAFPVVAKPEIITADGIPAQLSMTTDIPDTPKTPDPQTGVRKTAAVSVGDTTSATPRVHPDGWVTCKLSYTSTRLAGPSDSKTAPPKTVSQTLDTTRAFHPGDTIFLGQLDTGGIGNRLVFATVAVVPAGRGQ